MSREHADEVVASLRAACPDLRPLVLSEHEPDPLAWPGYPAKRAAARASTGTSSAITALVGRTPSGAPLVIIRWQFAHMGGTMGTAEGRHVVRCYAEAQARGATVVVVVASGGARMQEGMAALAQLASTVAAARAHADAGLVQIAVLTHPTTGGVFASHSNVADLRWATPDATIGFAGPRVAKSLTGGALPDGSHTSQSALAAGLVDEIVAPDAVGPRVVRVADWAATLALDVPRTQVIDEPRHPRETGDAWEAVRRARDPQRARTPDHLAGLDVATELFGDGSGTRDDAMRVALTQVAGRPVVVVALDTTGLSGGAVGPGGYRLAWRGFDLAQRLGIGVVTLVDTPGADASGPAEAAGIAQHIARTIDRMLLLQVPTVALVIGEGGSGGALALSVADRLLIQERATFSVIAPEGAAAILHRDARRADEVARLLDPTAWRLRDLGIADAVVAEPVHGEVAQAWAAVAWHLSLAARESSGALRPIRRRERWLARAAAFG